MSVCDWCESDGFPCVGQDAHCAAGFHCTATVYACNVLFKGGENFNRHGGDCHHCEAPLPLLRGC